MKTYMIGVWTDESIDRWMAVSIDGLMDTWIDGWVDGLTNIPAN